MSKYLLAFLLAAVVSCVMTPVAKRIACKLGAIDVPKDEEKGT